jgi:hypothetical protein
MQCCSSHNSDGERVEQAKFLLQSTSLTVNVLAYRTVKGSAAIDAALDAVRRQWIASDLARPKLARRHRKKTKAKRGAALEGTTRGGQVNERHGRMNSTLPLFHFVSFLCPGT